jgi:ERCC4-related helicase
MEDDIKCILQDKQFHQQLKSEQKEIIQIVLESKDSMAVLPTGFGKSMCYVLPPPSHFGQAEGKIYICKSSPMIHCGNHSFLEVTWQMFENESQLAK